MLISRSAAAFEWIIVNGGGVVESLFRPNLMALSHKPPDVISSWLCRFFPPFRIFSFLFFVHCLERFAFCCLNAANTLPFASALGQAEILKSPDVLIAWRHQLFVFFFLL